MEYYTTSLNKFVPKILYGTAWKKEKTADFVEQALKAGFRGIDTACQPKHYNEPLVGEGVKRCREWGLKREELFIQTKFTAVDGQDPNNIPYDKSSGLEDQVRKSLSVSLKNLGVDYIDSLILHSPIESLEKTLEVWNVFEEFVSQSKVIHLGLSNCYDPYFFQTFLSRISIRPDFLQNRFYPETGYDKELRKISLEQSIRYQSFWSLSANPHLLKHSIVQKLAKKLNKTPAQILLRFLIQSEIMPLTGTTNNQHMLDSLELFNFSLSESEFLGIKNLL